MRILRFRRAKWLAQGHPVNCWGSIHNSSLSDSRIHFIFPLLHGPGSLLYKYLEIESKVEKKKWGKTEGLLHFHCLAPNPDSGKANSMMFHSATVPPRWSPGELTRVKRLPGRLVLAAAQSTCANTATGTGKGLERVEKHQTLNRCRERSDSCRARTG